MATNLQQLFAALWKCLEFTDETAKIAEDERRADQWLDPEFSNRSNVQISGVEVSPAGREPSLGG